MFNRCVIEVIDVVSLFKNIATITDDIFHADNVISVFAMFLLLHCLIVYDMFLLVFHDFIALLYLQHLCFSSY